MVDAVKVDGRDKREVREDNETKIGVSGEVCIVEPVAEVVVTGSGRGGGESGGNGGVGRRGEEERSSRAVGVGEGGERFVGVRRY